MAGQLQPESTTRKPLPFIVAVGASAGGLEPFITLVEALQPDLNLSLIFVQHSAAGHDSALPELLSRHTRMRVMQVTDKAAIEPHTIYIGKPGTRTTIVDNRLEMSSPEHPRGAGVIDYLFSSLAAGHDQPFAAVILSGMGADGAQGIREIKAAGGITIAQDPASSRADSMPRAAIATGAVDLILPPDAIGAELVRIAQHPFVELPESPKRAQSESLTAEEQIRRVFVLLRNFSGVDFTHYKLPTIKRRLHRRMVLRKLTTLGEYLRHLQENPSEVEQLYEDLLIHVTRFFRDPDSYHALKQTAFETIMKHRRGDSPIRVWVPGCATGEEAYSIAIALQEYLGSQGASTPVQIFATDISESTIGVARAGFYNSQIEADVSPERLRRFFNKTEGKYRVSKTVRDMCIFARQDLTRDPPFSRMDLIVCRNVLIYLGMPLQKRILSVFHYALKPHGFLMLAAAETVGPAADLFVPADKRHRLYRKKPIESPAVQFSNIEPVTATRQRTRSGPHNDPVEAVNRVLLDRYTPPGVLINEDLVILRFRGQTGAYLQPAPGDASLSLLKMVRDGLLFGVRSAINEARKLDQPVRQEQLRLVSDGRVREVTVEVIPIRDHANQRYFMVLFEERKSEPAADTEKKVRRPRTGKPVPSQDSEARLQRELAASREYMQSIIQDLEAANEELQSANEEILSSNEELQSTNEELDTAKEELQSTNEELNTVNEELHTRNEELSRVNSDLINLLGSVQLAIVMIASDLRIRRFTPMAERVLNLIPSEVGRPISHIKPNIDYPHLEQLIIKVMEEVVTHEVDVQDRQGNWYSLRIRPYKDVENRIDGTVLALIDINASRQLASRWRAFTDELIQVVNDAVVVMNVDMRVLTVNPTFEALFGCQSGECVGKHIDQIESVARTGLPNRVSNMLAHNSAAQDFSIPGADAGQVLQARVRVMDGAQGGLIVISFRQMHDQAV